VEVKKFWDGWDKYTMRLATVFLGIEIIGFCVLCYLISTATFMPVPERFFLVSGLSLAVVALLIVFIGCFR
jgi:hypothetical protein